MSAMLLMLATTTVGVDWGYRPLPGGGLEYIIQIEPRVLDTLAGGREVVSTVPSSLRDVRRYRVTIGTQRLPRGGSRSTASRAGEQARGVHTRWRSIHSGAYEHVIELDPSAVDKMRREMDLVDDVRNVRRFRIRVRRGPEPTPVERGPIEPRPLAVSAPLRPVANPATDESAPARTFKEPEPTGEEKPKERSVIDRPAVAEPNPQPVEPEPGPVEPQEEPEPQDEPAGFELPDPLEDAPADPEPEVDAQPVAEPEIMEPMDPPANPEPNEPFPWPEAVPEPGAEKPVVEIPPVEKPVEEKPAGGTTPVPDEWPPTSPTEFPPIANPIEESQENVTPPAENAADKDEFNPFPLPSDPWPETPPPASEAASPPFAESTADPEPFPPTSELTSSLSNESPPSEPSPPEEADEGPEPPTKPRMASAAVNDDDKPWWALTTALFVLFASLGGNAYLGWINWGMRREYASLLAMLKQQRGGDRA